jgi:hypothetical protein
MRLTKLKKRLFATSLVAGLLSGCLTSAPPAPEVHQCAYSNKFKKFRCCNTRTEKCFNLSLTSGSMEGAQCLSLSDYRKSEAWVQQVIELAEQRCQ